MATEYYRTSLPVELRLNKKHLGSFQKAVSNYLEGLADENTFSDTYIKQLNSFVLKQPDLLYALSVLVSSGKNKNRDVFLAPILCAIFQTPRHKFVDFEHDAEGENENGKNPEGYQVIGHIYDSCLSTSENEIIPNADIHKAADGKWFEPDSPWRGKGLDVLVAWVLYKFQFPEIVEMILLQSELDPAKFGVSMEILFNDYKFRIGGSVDIWEEFDYDGNKDGVIEVKKGDALAKIIEPLWRKGLMYQGKDIVRILGGDIFFSGMAVTSNRANTRSINFSLATQFNDQFLTFASASKSEPTELEALISAVASKTKKFDMSQCKIVDGEPDCGCLEKAVSADIISLNQEIGSFLGSFANDPVKRVDTINGIDIALEWLKGEIRKYAGSEFETEMSCDYGYLINTKSFADGMEIDCYVGANKDAKQIYRITQLNDSGQFDEYKYMVGFNSPNEAKQMYLEHMPLIRFGGITEMDQDKFKEIANTSNELDTLNKTLSSMLEAVAKISKRKDVNPKEGKEKYGENTKFADTTNNKYDVSSPEKIRAAWNYIHQSRNAKKYSSKDLVIIKNKIIAAWKEKIDKDGPPSIAKGFYISNFLDGTTSDCPLCDDGYPVEGDHLQFHMNDMHNSLVIAQAKLNNLNRAESSEDDAETIEGLKTITKLLDNTKINLSILS